MSFRIPSHVFGKPVEGAIERLLKGTPPISSPMPAIPQRVTPAQNRDVDKGKYIILEGRTHGIYSYPDMLVPMQRAYLGKNWNQAYDALRAEDAHMLTIRQFADFLKLIKSGNAFDGNGSHVARVALTNCLNDIIEVRDPWRAEWLDASFKIVGRKMQISYNVLQNGVATRVTAPAKDYLNRDRTPGIDFNAWLDNATEQGLPSARIAKGDLYYWKPLDGAVAGFDANSGRADLVCNWDPQITNPELGVRAARVKK
ncbi:MAG TPA: hypothetical protein VJK03_01915 [Candidatus Nanoarchaeia archaeon]|nr:hypothetical protein [Candidatus Nanoarchaeia archaeon]